MTPLITHNLFFWLVWALLPSTYCTVSHSLLSLLVAWVTVCTHIHTQAHSWGRKSLWGQDICLVFITTFPENPLKLTEEQPADVELVRCTSRETKICWIIRHCTFTYYKHCSRIHTFFFCKIYIDNDKDFVFAQLFKKKVYVFACVFFWEFDLNQSFISFFIYLFDLSLLHIYIERDRYRYRYRSIDRCIYDRQIDR